MVRFFVGFKTNRANLCLLILGPYSPQPSTPSALCQERLVCLRNYLQSLGYDQARLMMDFPDTPAYDPNPASHFELKSKDKIATWAHGAIVVFLRDCDNGGAECEMTFIDNKNPDFFHSVGILIEKGAHVGAMSAGLIARHGIDVIEFTNDIELKESAVGHSTKILRRKISQL